MKIRVYFYTAVFSAFALVVACGPQHSHRLDEARKLRGGQGLNKATDAEVAADAVDLPNLADGKATYRQQCANPVDLTVKASEKEVKAGDKEIFTPSSVWELSEVTVFNKFTVKSGETGYISAHAAGTFQMPSDKDVVLDNAAQIICHNSTADAQKAPSEIVTAVPLQFNAQAGNTSTRAKLNLQARKGKTAARMTLQKLNIKADLSAADAPQDANTKSVMVLDNDKRLHLRVIGGGTTPDGGSGQLAFEAIYVKRK